MILRAEGEDPDKTMDVQADLGLCYLHMPQGTFLHGAAHIKISLQRCATEQDLCSSHVAAYWFPCKF